MKLLLIPPLLCLIALSGCKENRTENGNEPLVLNEALGSQVIVYLKRNDLGMAGNLPMPPDSRNHSGAKVTLQGKLTMIGDRGLEIYYMDAEMNSWIPYDSILHVMYPEE
jgi:hypothetical protein